MLLIGKMPWVDYLEIDEKTGQQRLKEETPKEIREKYNEFCEEMKRQRRERRPK